MVNSLAKDFSMRRPQQIDIKKVYDREDYMANQFESDMNQLSNVEKFSMNSAYLILLARLLDEFMITKTNGISSVGKYNPDYYYQMYEILDSIINNIACKLMKNPEDKQRLSILKSCLNKLSDDVDNVFMKSEKGVYMDKKKGLELRTRFGRLYEVILNIMDEKGLLTTKHIDVKRSMENFSD